MLFTTGLAAVACSIGISLRDFAALLGARVGRTGWRVPAMAPPPGAHGPTAAAWTSLSLTPERRSHPEPTLAIPQDRPPAAWPSAGRRREPALGGPRFRDPQPDPELEPDASAADDASDIDDTTDEASRAIAKRFGA